MNNIRLCHISPKNRCGIYKSITDTIIKNKLYITAKKISFEDVVISYNNSTLQLKTSQHNLLNDFDVFIFRIPPQKDLSKEYFIAKALKNAGKSIINETFSQYTTFADKLSFLNILQELNINHPQTSYADSKEILLKLVHEWDFPFILKDPYGWQGDTIFLIHTQADMNNALASFPDRGFIIQEYLPQDYDIRVITIGYKALGAMKRIASKEDFRSNLSVGGTTKHIPLTPELKNISETIAKHVKSAMLGIDFFVQDDIIYVNEIETCPGFRGFKQCTKTQPILSLLQYIIESEA